MSTVRQYGPAWIAAEFLAWMLFPVGLLWMVFDRVSRWLGSTPEQRVARMIRWYPTDWRARHGDAFGELLRDAIADGQDGPRLWLDVAREAAAVRLESALAAKRTWVAAILWTLGVLIVLPGTVVPLLLSLADGAEGFAILEVSADARPFVATVAIIVGLALIAGSVALFRSLARFDERRRATLRTN